MDWRLVFVASVCWLFSASESWIFLGNGLELLKREREPAVSMDFRRLAELGRRRCVRRLSEDVEALRCFPNKLFREIESRCKLSGDIAEVRLVADLRTRHPKLIRQYDGLGISSSCRPD